MHSRLISWLLLCCAAWFSSCASTTPATLSPEQARQIAKEAYIYGYPMVESYRIQHAYFVNRQSPEYKASFNQLVSVARVFTPEDKAVQTPNSDTPYSFIGLDLRAEPMVLSVPAIQGRYYSIQLIDAYTHNFEYLGSRTTGSEAGNFLIAGPNWKGEKPANIHRVLRSETELVLALFRTQLLNPADIDNVKAIQAQYKARPLSAFMGQAAPAAAPAIAFPEPLSAQSIKSSLEFFKILNFLLQFCPTVPAERELMARFAQLGIGAGLPFEESTLSPERKLALEQGRADAWAEYEGLKQQIDAKRVTSGELFGTREYLKNNYLYRMGAAILGIYGNSKQEAMYPIYAVDAQGQPLDGSHAYSLRFAAGQLPPVNAFWSLTMYELPSSLLVANPIQRYLLNSPMMEQFQRDADDGLSFHIQNASPGKEREPNWLPAPKGRFFMVLRLYWPKPAALDGTWTAPALERR